MNLQKSRAITVAAALTFAFCIFVSAPAFADELEDARQRDEELAEERRRLQEEQDEDSGELAELLLDMANLSDDIEKKKADIKEQEERYVDAKIKENDRYICMKKRIKFMYEDDPARYMLAMILESKSMSELLCKVEYLTSISTYDRNMLDRYALVVKDSEKRRAAMKKEYQELALMLDKMFIKQERLEDLIENRDKSIADLDAQIEENAILIDELIRKAEEEKEERDNYGSYEDPDGSQSGWSGGYFAHPCPGAPISSYFGWREFDNSFHKGVDFAAPEWTPTYAAEEGTVVIAGWSYSAGNWVVINHGGGLVTKYMHHVALCVEAGQYVERGQQIGYVGSTGYSTGPHLHFQVEVDSVAVDPLDYL